MSPDGTIFIVMCFVVRSVEALGTSAFVTALFAILAHEFPEHVITVMVSIVILNLNFSFLHLQNYPASISVVFSGSTGLQIPKAIFTLTLGDFNMFQLKYTSFLMVKLEPVAYLKGRFAPLPGQMETLVFTEFFTSNHPYNGAELMCRLFDGWMEGQMDALTYGQMMDGGVGA